MNKAIFFGVLTALLGLVSLIFILAADPLYPISQWPYEAFQGLTFLFVWGFGVPEKLGYVVSAVFVITALVVCFWIGHKLARLVLRNKIK